MRIVLTAYLKLKDNWNVNKSMHVVLEMQSVTSDMISHIGKKSRSLTWSGTWYMAGGYYT